MKKEWHQLYASALLVLAALAAVTAATAAWFSISDFSRVQTMGLEVVAGKRLRFDLTSHETLDEYVQTLSFEQINGNFQSVFGYSMETPGLLPVTTADGEIFSFRNGTVCEEAAGYYLTFTLHFMADADMTVHLTEESGEGETDGTAVTADNGDLPKVLRISFAADGSHWVYQPDWEGAPTHSGTMTVFGLAGKASMSPDTRLFSLRANEDKAVVVHIWMEGTDPRCINALQQQPYTIALRFVGETEGET